MTGSGDGRAPALVEKCAHGVSKRPARQVTMAVAMALTIALTGCSSSSQRPPKLSGLQAPQRDPHLGVTPSPRVVADQPQRRSTSGRFVSLRKGGGHRKLGKPYEIGGRWYTPKDDPDYDRTGIASWYGTDFHGRLTANGEIYDMNALTAAHKTLPLPSYAYVTNVANGRTVLVRINDRGPYAGNRIIDLSRAVARQLDLERSGIGRVRVQYAGPAPLDGNDYYERKFLAGQSWSNAGRLAHSSPPPQSRVRSAHTAHSRSEYNSWDPTAYRRGLGRTVR